MEGITRCCQNCKAPCYGDFKKAVDLPYSGIVIYIHTKKHEQQKKTSASKYADTYILHNTGTKQIERSEYIRELDRYKTKCEQCKTVVRLVRSLLEKKTIGKNEIIGVCEHCKRATGRDKTCKRCEFVVNEYIAMYEKIHKEKKQQRFNRWLFQVIYWLQAIIDGESKCYCQPKGYKDTELERILNAVKEPLLMREPDIDYFPNLDQEKLMSESKEMLDELFSKITFEDRSHMSSSESLYPSPSEARCLCKFLKDNFLGEISGFGLGNFNDSVLSSKTIEDFHRPSQEGYKSLLKRLFDLKTDIPQASHYLNRDFIEAITETINSALKQNLPKNVVLKLISELTVLNKTLTHDLSKNLNRKVISDLINDLNDLLEMESFKEVNQDLFKLFIDVTGLLTNEISNDLNTEQLRGQSKKEISPNSTYKLGQKFANLYKTLAAGGLDKNLVQELTSDINKIISGIPPDLLLKIVKELTKLCNPALHGIPNTANMKLVRGLITDASKALGQGLSKDRNKKNIQVLLKNLNNAIAPGTGEKQEIPTLKQSTLNKEDEKKTRNLKSSLIQKLSQRPIETTEPSEFVLCKLLKSRDKNAEKFKLDKKRQIAEQIQIPDIKMKTKRLKELSMKNTLPPPHEMVSESIVVCGKQQTHVPKLMISGDKIVPLHTCKENIVKPKDHEPLIFKTQLQFKDNESITTPKQEYQTLPKGNGTFLYQLSNEEFIHKGWTMLPKENVVRMINIYRTKPTNPQNCWFERHKHCGELFYDTGQKMADIDQNGRGHWYYRSGTIALEYYNAQESNIGQRYIVYSSGTEMECGKKLPRTILAVFDILGNGVVYDRYGNVRLKYNQSEGKVMDPKIGPPSKWKWHTLNDPPVLQRVFVDTYLKKRDPRLDEISKPPDAEDATKAKRPDELEMLQIELENFVKENEFCLKRKFRPFQIRMKVVKLNEQFSLKILDQTTIYLLYRDGATTLKLNLGLLLNTDEIIDTLASDVADIATPYDLHPAKTKSVENIQEILKTVRSGKINLPSDLTYKFADR